MARYSLDDIFTYEIQEEVVRRFCITSYEHDEDEEVRDACRILLATIALPGEDYDGILDPYR